MGNINEIKSNITGKTYKASTVVKILNIQQIIAYLKYGVELIDLYPSVDRVTNKPVLVALFNREDSKEAYDLWCKRELK